MADKAKENQKAKKATAGSPMPDGEIETVHKRTTAIVLAAGRGTRMGSGIQKQYLELGSKPLIYYALKAFEESLVDWVILVTGQGETGYCRKEIVKRYGFHKVIKITEGGRERHDSVLAGLEVAGDCDIVLIHDGARPCVTGEIIKAAIAGAGRYGACAVGMPVKDTVKIADAQGFSKMTPDRSRLWQIQTPQAFEYGLILKAYKRLFAASENQMGVTDDAMVVESMTSHKVKLIRGDYSNIKVTTPEDMELAKTLLERNGTIPGKP